MLGSNLLQKGAATPARRAHGASGEPAGADGEAERALSELAAALYFTLVRQFDRVSIPRRM